MRFVDDHRDQFAVALLLRVLEIEESTYYGWIKQVEQPCDRKRVLVLERGGLVMLSVVAVG